MTVSKFPHIDGKPGNPGMNNGNHNGNRVETMSLKALAIKVLQRNAKGNQKETSKFSIETSGKLRASVFGSGQ